RTTPAESRWENESACLSTSLRAKRSNPASFAAASKKAGLLRRFAPRNDGASWIARLDRAMTVVVLIRLVTHSPLDLRAQGIFDDAVERRCLWRRRFRLRIGDILVALGDQRGEFFVQRLAIGHLTVDFVHPCFRLHRTQIGRQVVVLER